MPDFELMFREWRHMELMQDPYILSTVGALIIVLILFVIRRRYREELSLKAYEITQLEEALRKEMETAKNFKLVAKEAREFRDLEVQNRKGIVEANTMLREENAKLKGIASDLDTFKRKAVIQLRSLNDRVRYFEDFGAKFFHETGASIREIQTNLSNPERLSSVAEGRRLSKRLDYIGELADLLPRLDLKVRVSELSDVRQTNLTRVADRLLEKSQADNLIVEDLESSLVIAGSPYHLEYLIVNLLRNAFSAADEVKNGEVHVRIQRVDETAQIQIVNDGNHIPEEISAQMYNLGATFREDQRESGRNLGYGLYLANQIAEGLGGTLVYENRVKTKGIMRNKTNQVVFCLRLPLIDNTEE